MDDEHIYKNGGVDRDVEEYSKQNGASPIYTDEQIKELTSFIAKQQQYLGGAMVLQMKHFGAGENTVHTEIQNPKVAEGKYLVTTTVRPLTEDMKQQIINEKPNE
jgi:2,4-dienoyl-CoA reductase-like NADH-dependent reductase (Old Yellow Enzyme family)